MKRTNRVSIMRLSYEILICLAFIVGSILLCIFSEMLMDQVFCLIAINICFLLVFILTIIKKRLRDELPENNFVSYGKLALTIFFSFVILVLCALYAPDYFAPVLLFPLIFSTVLDEGTNLALSTYLVLVLCISQNYGTYVVICYLILVIFGAVISEFIRDKKPLENLYSYVLILAINVLVSIVFYYFSFLEMNTTTFLYCLLDAVIVLVCASVFIPLFSKGIKMDQTNIYEDIIDPEYELCQDIRKFSYIEYQHALRVSKLSRLCAKEIGANEMLAACGGFYYRLGKMEGEPMIDNAIKLANNHCFPDELISILSEYGGIIALPSSRESAIVHMVDSVVTKVELFDADSMSSSWNQNMVIYQTINELSQNGIYDESGLSMNQFLSIREKLANEDILA